MTANSDGHNALFPPWRLTRILSTARLAGAACALCAYLICATWSPAQPPVLPSPDAESHRNPPAEEIFPDTQYNSWLPGPPTAASDADEFPLAQHEAVLLDEPAPTFSSGHWLFSGGWYVQAEAVVLLKTKLNDVPLAFDSSILGNPVVLTTSTDSPTYESGIRFTIGHILGRDAWNRDHMVEYTFFGLFDWETSARAVRTFDDDPSLGIETLLGPDTGDVAALHGNTSQRYIEHSSLDGYALNYRFRTRSTRDRMVLQHDGCWVRHNTPSRIWSYYGGVARIMIDEDFDLLGLGPETTSGRYVVSTTNDLVGIHFGGEYLEQHTFWQWGVRGRVGGLTNFAERRSLFQSTIDPIGGDPQPTTSRGQTVDKDNMAFLIEGGMFAAWQLSPNATIRAGYDFLYISGLAQATGNLGLPIDNFSPFHVTDDVIYHGGSVGFTVVW